MNKKKEKKEKKKIIYLMTCEGEMARHVAKFISQGFESINLSHNRGLQGKPEHRVKLQGFYYKATCKGKDPIIYRYRLSSQEHYKYLSDKTKSRPKPKPKKNAQSIKKEIQT